MNLINKTDKQKAVKVVISGKAVVLDVRTKSEYKSSHAVGAQNVELVHLLSGIRPKADKSTPIYVYCHSGARAGIAARSLTLRGYNNVNNVGGLSDWEEAGGKLEM